MIIESHFWKCILIETTFLMKTHTQTGFYLLILCISLFCDVIKVKLISVLETCFAWVCDYNYKTTDSFIEVYDAY